MIDQRLVVHAGRGPHHREARRRCEAGHRVDLVEIDPAIGEVEEVDSRQPLAAERVERPRGVLSDPLGDVLRNLRGYVGPAAAVDVLRLEVVPGVSGLRLEHDLARQAGEWALAVARLDPDARDLAGAATR